MMKKPQQDYEPEACAHCGQTTTYLLGLDRGSVDILKAVARAIEKKGINIVHVNKELVASGMLRPLQMTNMSRPRAHGLIATVKGNRGNYLLTRKGAAFLRGESVPKYAIMSKVESRQIGYYRPEDFTVEIKSFSSADEYWEGIGYDIIEGRVVRDVSEKLPIANQPSLI